MFQMKIAHLRFFSAAAALTLALAPLAHAQEAAEEKPGPPRARAPSMALSAEAVQTAMTKCQSDHYKITGLMVDSAGVPIVMMSSDGVKIDTQDTAQRKAWTTLIYKQPSGLVRDRVKLQGDKTLEAALLANPKIGRTSLRGALPVIVNGEIIGAIAVAGAPGGYKDEPCAQAGLDRIAARLK
jgi:uncharacterized protein GlcG (DUF336 family)